MNKFLGMIATIVLLTGFAINANAAGNGFVQPGAGISIRHLSNGVGWQNQAGIGLFDTFAKLYGVMTTDKVIGQSWGIAAPANPSGICPTASGYCWTGEAYLDHLPITNPNYLSGPVPCAPGPKFAYTTDPCTWGLSAEDVPWQTIQGIGPDPVLSDLSLVYMSAYPLFHDGAESTLIFQPMGISGNLLSNQTPFPPNGELLDYYNNGLQNIDFGTVATNSEDVLVYDGPDPIACDQYNDCQWTQPSGFTSNYGAPAVSTAFWTWPSANGNGLGAQRNTYNFIYNNSQYFTGVMQVNTESANPYSVEGGSFFSQNGTHALVGHAFGRVNGNNNQIIVTHAETDIFLLNWRCNGFDLCGQKQYYNWTIAGANTTGTGLGPQYQVSEALPLIGLEMPSTDLPKLPNMDKFAVPQPGELSPALQAAINLEATHKPDIKRLNALVDRPTQVISPVYTALDRDGVIRHHVGVVDLNNGLSPMNMKVHPSAAMTMSITREYHANGATAPIVVEPGYIAITGKGIK